MITQTTEVDLNDVKEFIESSKFADYLLSNTTNFSTAAYILQALLERLELDLNKKL